MAVQHEVRHAVEPPARAIAHRAHRRGLRRAAAVVVRRRHRDDRPPRGDLGEKLCLGRVVRDRREHADGEDRGREIGPAKEHAPHLFHHDRELHGSEPRSAVSLGCDEPRERHLGRQTLPDARLEAALGLHGRAHGGFARFLLEKSADGLPQLLVLFREREVHHRALGSGTSRHGTSLSARGSPGRPSTRSPRMLRMNLGRPALDRVRARAQELVLGDRELRPVALARRAAPLVTRLVDERVGADHVHAALPDPLVELGLRELARPSPPARDSRPFARRAPAGSSSAAAPSRSTGT